ncbi:MAG: glycosyltransferase family 2 protein [Cyanobacteria bacterium]|nr:glycosyltransferase family 2 protein [Cyanobacteriota bacterium]MDA0865213.1 glycosyltransferase family 2 protein [Cyanobacteriota bacterium]
MPKVSVCIPTYNRAELLNQAIQSVLDQRFEDFELIICDDGSQDGTPTMMASLADPRIHYLRHPANIGKSNNMISGFRAAQGDYFIKFDDDDRLTPDFLADTVAVLEAHPEVDFVSTDHWVINPQSQRDLVLTDANSARWGRTELPAGVVQDLLPTVFVRQCLQVGATLFRRSVLEAVNYMRPNLQNCEDNDLFVRLAMAGKQAYYLPDRLMEYRFHPEQQGIGRAIPYLRDKIAYLEAFKFPEPAIETIRQQRLKETQLLLGLRLIETGDTKTGTALVKAGQGHSPKKAQVGLALAKIPMPLRPAAFGLFRSLKPLLERS